MPYLNLDTIQLENLSEDNVTEKYADGYYFGRIGKGIMTQTRLLRINLSSFSLSSENKRILRKTGELSMGKKSLPLSTYHWSQGKLMKDFYEQKFGPKTFSAQKAKEVLATPQSNFNLLLTYSAQDAVIGYAVCYENNDILHYSYPFYDLSYTNKNIGMGMMIRAINYAKETHKQYIYLGSVQRPTDTYKLQFSGLEWFDGHTWTTDLDALKQILAETV